MLIEQQLASIMAYLKVVWHFNASTGEWEVYDTTPGSPDTLTTLIDGEEYDIEVTQGCILSYSDDQYHYSLQAGWNHITWQKKTVPPPPVPPLVEITSVTVNPSTVKRGELLTVTVWLSVVQPQNNCDLAVFLMEPPGYGSYRSLVQTGYRDWPAGSYSQVLHLTVDSLQALGTNQVNANLYSANGPIVAFNYQTRVEVEASSPPSPPEITPAGSISAVEVSGDLKDGSSGNTLKVTVRNASTQYGQLIGCNLQVYGTVQVAGYVLKSESRKVYFAAGQTKEASFTFDIPAGIFGQGKAAAILYAEDGYTQLAGPVEKLFTVSESPPPSPVEITSVAVTPSKVSKGEKLQITTWVSVIEAFSGYLAASLMEPLGYTGYKSSTSTQMMNWAAGSYSKPVELTVDTLNAPGANKIRVSIIDSNGHTLAQDTSKTVEVTDEVLALAAITALEAPSEIGQGEDLLVRVQGTVRSAFEGYFNAILLEPPDWSDGQTISSSPMLSFSPPGFDGPATLTVRRDNALGVNRLRVRLIKGNEVIAEKTKEITVKEASTLSPLAQITNIEVPPQVGAGEELQLRIQGTVAAALEANFVITLLGPPDYQSGSRWDSPAPEPLEPPSFDLGAGIVIPQTQPAGVNRLVVTLLQGEEPLSQKTVTITVKTAEGSSDTSDIMGPMMGMMGMSMMMGMLSSVGEMEGS